MSKIEECNCMCHTNSGIIHFTPCCNECEYCGKNIKINDFNKHIKNCKKEFDELNKKNPQKNKSIKGFKNEF